MIRFLQKKGALQKALWAIIIGITCVSMVAFLGSYFTDASGAANVAGVYATVGDQQVTVEEIREAARNMGRQQFQGQAVPEQFMRYFMPQAATQLLLRKAVIEQADRMGLTVSDNELLDYFHQGEIGRQLYPNGKYVGRDQAATIIYQNTGLSPEKFQAAVKEDLMIRKVLALIQGEVTVPESEVQQEFTKQNVKVKFDYAIVDRAELAKKVTVTDPELRAYFEKNKPSFQDSIPEKRKISYMVIDATKIPVTITDADYQKAYQQNQEQYKTPEEVDVRHILVKTEEQAKDIKKQLEGGADFAALAKKYSEDPGSKDTGGLYKNVQHGKMVPEFDKAAFSLPVGKISDPVKTSFGYHILKVDAHRPAGQRSLAEVKPEIESQLRAQMEQQAAEKLATQVLADARSAGMAKAAAQHNLTLTTTDFVAADAALPGLGVAPDAMQQIFGFQKDTPSRADAGENVVIADVLDVHPRSTPTFEQAKSQVEERFRQERASQMLGQKVQELADKAKQSGSLKQAAKEMALTVKTSDLVSPRDQVSGLGSLAENAPAVFDLKQGQVSDPVRANAGAAVLQVQDKQQPPATEFAAKKDQIREQLVNDRRGQALSDFARNAYVKMVKDGSIKINPQEQARLSNPNS
jgi:peptidyl-prolyl cis-trans isomerase D